MLEGELGKETQYLLPVCLLFRQCCRKTARSLSLPPIFGCEFKTPTICICITFGLRCTGAVVHGLHLVHMIDAAHVHRILQIGHDCTEDSCRILPAKEGFLSRQRCRENQPTTGVLQWLLLHVIISDTSSTYPARNCRRP